ncbi:MAG: transglutaminase domain-containing protein [Sedimentisphaerales bacterium]|nr:transglutaminase domain-containing protein [Sedimentisphaerales bacterium]
MKRNRMRTILPLITLMCLLAVGERSPARQKMAPYASPQIYHQSNTVELKQTYDFTITGETNRISFLVPLPQSQSDRQDILSISYDPKPSRMIERDGKRYAEFVFERPEKQVKATICIKAELFTYDLFTAMKNRKNIPPEEDGLDVFLNHEKYIEKDSELVQEIADGIEGRTEMDVVHKIYEYVTDHMEYADPSRQNRGAVIALLRGEGDCTEYADLFVALCRAKNLPARVIAGYVVRFDSESPKHNWAEVYLRGYGWIPFDPSAGDFGNFLIRGRAFSRMRPGYFYLSHIRNDEMLGDHCFGVYTFWGDKPRFKESVDFEFLSSAFQCSK